MAKQSREALIKKILEEKDDETSRAVYGLTTNPETGEVAKKWAMGPYTEQQMHERYGHQLWTASRRFGVVQKDLTTKKENIRQIDDFSEDFVNACTTIKDKVAVDGVDAIANVIRFWADKIREGKSSQRRRITITLESGERGLAPSIGTSKGQGGIAGKVC